MEYKVIKLDRPDLLQDELNNLSKTHNINNIWLSSNKYNNYLVIVECKLK